jgi:phage-related protein
MRKIEFYKASSGKSPIQEYLDTLSDKATSKVLWVLKLVKELVPTPTNYFKKLSNTNDIWEARIDVGNNTYRFLGFFDGKKLVVLTNAFQKKTKKTPPQEIKLAEKRKRDYLERKKNNG